MRAFELFSTAKDLYGEIVAPVCKKYNITFMEFNVLMFLANNPQYDTASEIVKKRRLSKSHVSVSVRSLYDCRLISCEYRGENHRSVHLKVCDAAIPIITDGRAAQNRFGAVLYKDFSENEKEKMQEFFVRINNNIDNFSESR